MPDTRDTLFNDEALDAAARQGSDSHFRWLALSGDPEAVALRAGLERCFAFAGRSAGVLRKGLMHERWGQHVGALGHLLTLGMLVRQGWDVECEPPLGGQSPDILATRGGDGLRLIVEVRSITGAGRFPWEARRLQRGPGRATPAEREAQARAAVAAAAALRETVAGVLARKADRYGPLVARLGLPFVICLYEDKDDQIAQAVLDVVADGGSASSAPRAGPRAGAALPASPAGAADDLRAVSAVIVLGRADTEDGALLLRGELIPRSGAAMPLPAGAAFPLLRTLGAEAARAAQPPPAAQPPRAVRLFTFTDEPLRPRGP